MIGYIHGFVFGVIVVRFWMIYRLNAYNPYEEGN